MFYNKNTIADISKNLLSEYKKYENKYDDLKSILNLNGNEIRVIWSNTWTEPFHSDFISEIDNGAVNLRKIIKVSENTKRLNGYSKHFFEKKPIYSVFWGEKNEPICEKFFVHDLKEIIGLKYLSDRHKLLEVTIEQFDNNGKVLQYDCGQLEPYTKRGYNEYPDDINLEMNMKSRKYYYEKNAIVKAEAFDEYYCNKDIIWYDDEAYNGVANVLTIDYPHMNPETLKEYYFNYNTGSSPATFTRKNFSYGKITENTWKFSKKLREIYLEYGIKNFEI